MKKLLYYMLFTGMLFTCQSQALGMEDGRYYLYEVKEEEEVIVEQEIQGEELKDFEKEEEILQYTFQRLFGSVSEENLFTFIPEDTKLIGLQLVDHHLDLNVSKEILQYGGSRWECLLVNQILATAFHFEKVESVSLLIEGEETYLPEGTTIITYSREQWEERMNTYNGTSRSEDTGSN